MPAVVAAAIPAGLSSTTDASVGGDAHAFGGMDEEVGCRLPAADLTGREDPAREAVVERLGDHLG